MSDQRCEFWIDVGGTFTDCIARLGDGSLRRHKLLSSEDAPILAIRRLLGLARDQAIPPVTVRLATTRGTNALITRSGAKTAFVTTLGFGDVLAIGYQARPRIFELAVRKPTPLAATVLEVDERVTHDGDVLRAPDEEAIRGDLMGLHAQGIVSLAICLLHADLHPAHEQLIARVAREIGFDEISVSHEVAPLVKIVARGDTTVVDAYLNPVLRDYVARLRGVLPGSTIHLLTSAGGLVAADRFRGHESILSGPAGGVVGYSRVAAACGFDRCIGFDMGGTSTDVSRFEGQYELEYETQKAGVRIVSPAMAIETVAAGGGSICRFDGVKLVVGPRSAGADPGPACYGRGGPLAVTDLNLLLGKIPPERFPFPLDRAAVETRLAALIEEVAAATGRRYTPIELADGLLAIANANMAAAIRSVTVAKGADPSDFVLVAFGGAAGQHACAMAAELDIARILIHPDAGILSALGVGLADVTRRKSVGVYQLLCEDTLASVEHVFATSIDQAADELRSEGFRASEVRSTRILDLRYWGIEHALAINEPKNGDWRAAFERAHRRQFGYTYENRDVEVVAARVEATATSKNPNPSPEDGGGEFRKSPQAELPANRSTTKPETVTPVDARDVVFDGVTHETPVYDRDRLPAGTHLDGPVILAEANATTVIDPGWSGEVLAGGELLLGRGSEDRGQRTEVRGQRTEVRGQRSEVRGQRSEVRGQRSEVRGQRSEVGAPMAARGSRPAAARRLETAATTPDPVALEVFNNQLVAIAERMGTALRHTASSVNVKERLDYSCAVFTADGKLVANAPHMPVHLGAMGETVRCVLADNPDLRSGDVYLTNDPFRGGSHLPDITVVSPVHEERTGELRFFTASRAHHAEIGGIAPGSMPALATTLAEEGVLIRNFRLIAGGESREDELRAVLLAGPHPTRAVDDNLADIAAQVAANRQGAIELQEMIDRHSWPFVQAYMTHVQEAAAEKTRQALAKFAPGRRTFTDYIETRHGESVPIAVAITIRKKGVRPLCEKGVRNLFQEKAPDTFLAATIDFAGSGPVVLGNLNANRSIVTAAVIYCLRLLIDDDIPLNDGVLAPVELVIPLGLLNPGQKKGGRALLPERPGGCFAQKSPDPFFLPAVAGGNVETSQRVVDVVLGAFGVAAASQGTMNNLVFGDESFGYYETICGGAGATSDASGADAVQTHMTNTRLTDPEILERRYPVRLHQFAIRRRSGGAGRHRGGDGVVREIEFLKPLTVSLLMQRRGPHAPYGQGGGLPGALGRNLLLRADGSKRELPGICEVAVRPRDRLRIETPGGGGFGDRTVDSQ